MKRILTLLMLLILGVAAAGYWLWFDMNRYMQRSVSLPQSIHSFQIKKGTSFNSVLSNLEELGVIDKTHYVEAYARLHQIRGRIKAGEYRIPQAITPAQLLEQLVNGKSVQHSITIIEGTRFKDLLALLEAKGDIIEHSLSGMTQQQILNAIGTKETYPEGLFLADTFNLERGTSDLQILKRSYRAMQQVLQDQWEKRDKKLPYKTPYEALIMASIIEKETGVAAERPRIAGVFVKRLNEGMRLQTDPTVIYGMGEKYRGNIRRKDLRKPTPYNTYVINGLPPTPIALVGRASIQAALNPEMGPWRYFVAKGNGHHQFSATLAQHNKAVRQYQLKRKKGYQSSPSSKAAEK